MLKTKKERQVSSLIIDRQNSKIRRCWKLAHWIHITKSVTSTINYSELRPEANGSGRAWYQCFEKLCHNLETV